MRILLADDHLMTLEGYISILNNEANTYLKAQSCKELYKQILKLDYLDLAIIDHDMPGYEKENLHSGLDCSLLIKEKFPFCKIILITAHEQALILYSIYQKRSIDALVVKSDFTSEILHHLTTTSLPTPYYLSLIHI